MIRIDDSLLEEIGLIALPKAERDQLLRQIYETLEMRVGMRLAERMTDQQLDEFEAFIDTNDEAGALKWLETNFPDYKDVVASELDKLKGEIKQDSGKIVEAMQSAGAVPAGAAQPQVTEQVSATPMPTSNPVQPEQVAPVELNQPSQQPAPASYQTIPPPPISPHDQDQAA